MSRNIYIVAVFIFILGVVTPYITSFVVFQLFFLMVPMILCILISFFIWIIFLVYGFVTKDKKLITHTSLFFILPILFLGSQVLSTITVEKIQRRRCISLIESIKESKDQKGIYPENIERATLGIKYTLTQSEGFELEYECGFLIREVYNSTDDKWERYGWND